jgi:superfamily II DNA or RNA helicase
MSAPRLRPYQETLIARVRASLRTHRRSILQSPTGSGKTVLTAHMIRTAAEKGMSATFLVHRRELLEQTSRALRESDVEHGVVAGGRSLTKEIVQIATIQTLARRLDRVQAPNLLIIDEAHHTAAKSYRTVLDAWPDTYVVGLTATPCRTDGRGLDDLFSGIVLGPTVQYLTAQGYLAPYRIIAPPSAIDLSGVHRRGGDFMREELAQAVDRATIVGDAVAHYRKYVQAHANGRPPTCLVYCVSRAHAHHVEEAYRAEGIDARYCAGDTPEAERRAIVDGFRRGSPPVIVSVDLFGEGLDVPGLFAVQLLRPTESLSLHLQQIGRALRPEAGKEYALILDHVGNSWRHGLPDDSREWSLEGERKGRKASEETAPSIRVCEHCFAVYRVGLLVCPVCGMAPPASEKRRGPDVVDGELQEIDPEEHRRRRRWEAAAAAREGLEALVRHAIKVGHKAAWAGIYHATKTGGDRVASIREAQKLWFQIKREEEVA